MEVPPHPLRRHAGATLQGTLEGWGSSPKESIMLSHIGPGALSTAHGGTSYVLKRLGKIEAGRQTEITLLHADICHSFGGATSPVSLIPTMTCFVDVGVHVRLHIHGYESRARVVQVVMLPAVRRQHMPSRVLRRNLVGITVRSQFLSSLPPLRTSRLARDRLRDFSPIWYLPGTRLSEAG